jgi:hypothetical protein
MVLDGAPYFFFAYCFVVLMQLAKFRNIIEVISLSEVLRVQHKMPLKSGLFIPLSAHSWPP